MLDINGKMEAARNFYTVTLAGRLDSRTAREFEKFQEELISAGRVFLVLDARKLSYVSSSGIASLLGLVRRLRGRGAAVLLAPNQEVRLLLSFFGIDEYLPAVNNQEEAARYLAGVAAQLGEELAMEMGAEESLPDEGAQADEPHKHSGATAVASRASASNQSSSERPVAIRSGRVPELHSVSAQAVGMGGADVETLRKSLRADIRDIIQEILPDALRESASLREAWSPPGSGQAPASHSPGLGVSSGAATSTGNTATGVVGAPGVAVADEPVRRPLGAALLLRCDQCGGRLRVRQSGKHMCPHCRSPLLVSASGSVEFLADLAGGR